MSNTQYALYGKQRVNRNKANFGQQQGQMAPEKPNGLPQPRENLEVCRPLRGQRAPEQLGPVGNTRLGIARCNAKPKQETGRQPEPVALHQHGARPVQLGLTAIEEPEESPQEKQIITLKNFAAQLKSLSMAIHTSQVEIQGWEQLDIVHKRSQQFNSEKIATMKECDTLKKQVRVLQDKAQNHSMFQNLLKTAKEEKEQMDSERDGLMQKMEEQQEKFRSFQQLKLDCEQARQENVEIKGNIKVLEFKLQGEFALEEALFNRSTADKEAIDQENLALKLHFQELQTQVQLGEAIKKQNLAVQITVAEAHLQNEDLQKEVQLLNQRLDEVKVLKSEGKETLARSKALETANAGLNHRIQEQIQELQTQVQLGEAFKEETLVVQASNEEADLQNATLQQEVQLLKHKLDEVKVWKSEGRKTQARSQALETANARLNHRIQKMQRQVQLGEAFKKETLVVQASNVEARLQNTALQQEVQLLNHTLDELKLWRSVASETQARSEALEIDNARLNQQIQELETQVQLGETFKKETLVVQASNEEADLQNAALQQEVQLLNQKLDEVKLWTIVGSETQARSEALEIDNAGLNQQIQAANEQLEIGDYFRCNISVLEDKERTLVEENGVLFETHSKAILRLLQQEDYKRKFDVLKEKTDSLKLQITEKSETIQGLNNGLEVLMEVKKNYKALKPEKAALIRQNKAVQKNLRVLEKKVSHEQTYAGKNAVLQSEMVALNLAKDNLQEQVKELRE
ncbi:paramyosin-like [Pseudoliparis swirei]|uniref:paramyosin-like n=1 Tax=Pseudoliparis swirei TaxID=2059687 RepID=UPI0024BE1D22|nr:paramyosin-like [Pseudoliparis swirei]